MKPKNPIALLIGWLALATAPLAPGQAQPQPAQTPDEEVVRLSPFEVTTDQDAGYVATNTLAGSRFNTPLRDTPASIDVLTPEFLSDIGAFTLEEALEYAGNIEFALDDTRAVVNGDGTVRFYQGYRVRGLGATLSRNYFRWDVPAEIALVERIEDSRGPNSVLFGIASPGGLINVMTKQAQLGRAFQEASFSVGSYDSKRATLDINQPLLEGKLALRLNAVYNDTQTFRHWQYEKNQRAHLAAKYVLTDRTRIRAEFERGQIDSNEPRHENLYNSFLLWNSSGRPTFATQTANVALGVVRLPAGAAQPRVTYIGNNDSTISMRGMLETSSAGPAGDGPITDRSIADFSVNVGGPAQDRFSRFDAFSAFLDHQFSKDTFLELAYNHQDHIFDRYDPRGGIPQSLKGDPNKFLNGGTPDPFAGQLYLEGNWRRIVNRDQSDTGRATFSTELDAGKWGNYRIAALTEYEKAFIFEVVNLEKWVDAVTGAPAFNKEPENGQNTVWRRSYITEGDWRSYHLNGPGRAQGLLTNVFDPVTGRTLSSRWVVNQNSQPGETYVTQKTYLLAGQARYFGGRLIIAAGFRRDDLDAYNVGTRRDPVTNEWSISRNDAEATHRLNRSNSVGRTKTAGFVYHVKPWLSVFGNLADSVNLPSDPGITRLRDSGEPGNPVVLGTSKGEGRDAGLALELFEGRIHAKVTYYETEGVGQSTTSPIPVRNANEDILDALLANGLIGKEEHDFRNDVGRHGLFDHKSDGWEVQITANRWPTKNWRFRFNYAFTDAVEGNKFAEWLRWHALNLQYLSQFPTDGNGNIVNPVTGAIVKTDNSRTIAEEINFYLTTNDGLNEQTELSGLGKLGNRHHKVNFFTHYDFQHGWLKGASIGGGFKYQSQMFAGLDPDRRRVRTPSFWNADAMVGYEVQGLRKGRKLKFQLNVDNVFDDRDPLITRYSFATGERLVFREVPQSPLTWRLTTSFEY